MRGPGCGTLRALLLLLLLTWCILADGVLHMHMSRNTTSRKMVARAHKGDPVYMRLLQANRHGARLNRAAAGAQRKAASPVPLIGCPFADFTIPVAIGASTFELLVDTGSSTLAVAGAACQSCAGVSPLWQATTAVSINQHRMAAGMYGDGSGWRADVWRDTVRLPHGGNSSAASMRLAVMNAQSKEDVNADGSHNPDATPFFIPDVCADHTDTFMRQITTQGIIGFGFSGLASGGTDSFPSELFRQHAHLDKTFAMQMCADRGSLWIGGTDNATYLGEPLYTPVTQAAYWSVAPSGVYIDDETLNVSFADFTARSSYVNIVDSGTTMWELPTAVHRKIVDRIIRHPAFRRLFRSAPHNNFFDHSSGWCEGTFEPVTWQELQRQLPTITLQFANGLSLTMDGVGSYMLPCNAAYDQWTPGIGGSEFGMIGGWPLMNQFVVMHDMQSMRVGFAPALGCDKPPLRANVTMGKPNNSQHNVIPDGNHNSSLTSASPTFEPTFVGMIVMQLGLLVLLILFF